ncbi:ArfGap-domain-containing protein [Anaeromyces robustus]|uniref:ArfGap-domain-containing protein n=1 Tax=Anaeromyces robustus TaxID=1754192 RepID=A0A1Y1XKT6_9FUNG|nr:ArfGap-domain-containing protein [Anaeromyces robustus]|eukprot:ORX86368.1 ArfGap-domain-containing protein [Anaeromyces robustus]
MPKKEKDFERQKKFFKNMVEKDPMNNYCCECGAKGPQWASTNLGIFLCIRCASIHRKLGTHISKVKSLTLDNWSIEQLEEFQKLGGNTNANNKYLGNAHPRPVPLSNTDKDLEVFIRDKYERKYYMNSKFKEEEIKQTFTESDYRQYSSQLNNLKDMGFSNETHNLMLLKQLNGNLDAVAEILITESSDTKTNNNRGNMSNSSASNSNERKKPSTINTHVNLPARTASMNKPEPSPRHDSLRHCYTSPRYEYANGLNQLKAMGFTDIIQMKSALEKVYIFIIIFFHSFILFIYFIQPFTYPFIHLFIRQMVI